MNPLLQPLLDTLEPNDIHPTPESLLIDQRRRYRGNADCVLQPNNIASIQKIMKFCFENRIPVTPQGGNTGLCGAAVPMGGILLNLSRLNTIRRINLEDNVITVDAGCILQNVQQAATQHHRLFPLSLASEGSCQIGGNIACNAGGLNVLRYGTMRDLVIGLEVVLPNGEYIEHLSPLHKNTTGYDLRQLFIGSEGTLGIITGATLKLFAQPQTRETAWIGVNTIQEAVNLLILIRNQFNEKLTSFEIISRFALHISSQFSQITPPIDSEWHILLELTDTLSHNHLADQLLTILSDHQLNNSVLAQSEAERQQLWTLRENISAAQRQLGANIKHDIAMPIENIATFIQQCEADLHNHINNIQIVVFGHLGDGSLHYNTFIPHIANNDVYQYEHPINTIVYRNVLAQSGTIAAEHGIGKVKNHWLPSVRSPIEIQLMRAIKKAFDPHNIMNPNKLLPDTSSQP